MNFGESLTFRSGAVGFLVFEGHLSRDEPDGLCDRTTEAVNAREERGGGDVHCPEVFEKVRFLLCRDKKAREKEIFRGSRCQWSGCVRQKLLVFSQNVDAKCEITLLGDKAGCLLL